MAADGEAGMKSDDRIVRESGVEARVAAIVEPVLVTAGYRLVRVRLTAQNGQTLQIMAERPDGTMTVEDCEEVSRVLSPVLDVEDPLDKAYNLEISSPGIDRPLVRASDFVAAQGHLVKLETSVMVAGRKRFRGRIAGVDDSGFTVEREEPAYGEEPSARIPFEALGEARLILTDDLIREALKQDKKERQDRRKHRRGAAPDDEADEASEAGAPETEH